MTWTPSRVALAIVAVAVALSVGTTVMVLTTTDEPRLGAARPPAHVTQANYERLAHGMSYAEAAQILGPGTEISRADLGGVTTVMYRWRAGTDGANMNATFQDDQLVSKAQMGLR